MMLNPSQDRFVPSDPAFVQDPYPVYRALRESDPVHRTSSGIWVVSHYCDVAEGLKDPRFGNAPAPFALVNRRNSDRYLAARVANELIAFMAPPDHLRPRRLIASAFQKHVRDKEGLVREVADDLLANLRGRNEIEFVSDFAIPFATSCICRLVGLDEADARHLKHWSGLFFYLFHAVPSREVFVDLNSVLAEFRDYVRDAIVARRDQPRDDLLSAMMAETRHDDRLSDEETVHNAMLLIADGIENVQAGLANSIYALLKNASPLDLDFNDDQLADSVVAECLRFESPGQYQGRIALEPVNIRGREIKRHSIVLFLLGSANRDPEAYENPDVFLPTRQGPRHLAFGVGRHACIGGMLVEMEFRAALRSLFDGSRTLGLKQETVKWAARAGHRWPEALPLVIGDH